MSQWYSFSLIYPIFRDLCDIIWQFHVTALFIALFIALFTVLVTIRHLGHDSHIKHTG